MKRSPIFKRILALALSVVLCLSALPMTEVSAATVVDSGSCGENLTWTLDDTGKLTISGSGAMTDYSWELLNSPFFNDSRILFVEIEDGVTSIGEDAFDACSNLAGISIPDSVTTIGDYAFFGCWMLDGIALPKNLTSIGSSAFESCDSLSSITIPDSVTSIGDYAFHGCWKLTDITIPAGVTSIGDGAFSSCKKLISVLVDSENTAYTSVDGVLFSKDKTALLCYPMGKTATSYTVPDTVTEIGHAAFYNCGSLTSVTLPESVTVIDDKAFEGCYGLSSITLPSGITTIGDEALIACSNLSSITLPSSITDIGYAAFFGCSSLKDVYYAGSQADWEEITVGDYNDPLKNATVHYNTLPDTVVDSGSCGENLTWTLDDTGKLTISGSGEMFDLAFYGDTRITSVEVLNGVTSIGDFAFEYCTNLIDIVLPDSVTSIGGGAFFMCSSLMSVTIPDSVTSIGDGAFERCSNLTAITVDPDNGVFMSENGVLFDKPQETLLCYPAGKTESAYTVHSSVTSISDGAFAGCESLTSITIPDSVTSIGDGAFAGCSKLTSITIPDGVASIEQSAFYGCSSLTSVTIPDSVTSIGSSAFDACTSLTSITIPDSVTSIGEYAFKWCESLTSITIPDSVTSIGYQAFNSCNSLTDVYYAGSQADWEKITVEDYNDPLMNATIHYNALSSTVVDSGTCGENLTWTLDDTGKLTISGTGEMFDDAFSLDNRITSVEIKNGVTSIGNEAFYYCTSLTSITIPDSVTSIGDGAIYMCSSLTSITIPDSVTSIGNHAFSSCASLIAITVDPDNGIFMSENGVLFDKSQETLLCYPAGKTESAYTVPSSVTTIGDGAFAGCSNLTSITIPDGVTSIDDGAFSSCVSLTSITIPDSVTSISYGAFAGCSNLAGITIPDSVTSIGDGVFYGCSSLTSITFPSSITDISYAAFAECNSLKDVYYTGSQADWEEITVGDYNDPLLNATVHYADLPTVAVQMDVASFRSGETYTAPSKEGCVFAGWYKDAAMTVPLGETVTTGTAYAKFVDEDVLSVKWQLSSGTTADSAKTALRVLTTVDALSYSRVGFTVEAPGKATKELTSKTVYETIYGYTGSNNESYKPTIFAHTSKYFMAHTLSGIPQSDFTKEIKVTPKWTTLDGTEVTGKPLTIRIADAIGG